MPAIPRQMLRISVNVPVDAGNACSQVIPVEGDFVYIETIVPVGVGVATTVLPFTIKPDSGPAVKVDYAHHMLRWANPFTSLLIESAGGSAPFILTLVVGFGLYSENRPLKKDIFAANRTITRLNNATPYAANQMVGRSPDGLANSYCEFFNVFKFGSRYSRLTRARIIKSTANVTNANFRLHLFSPNLTPANSIDQLPYVLGYNYAPCLLGVINFPLFISGGAGSDAASCDIDGLDVLLTCPDGGYTSIHGQLECLAAYTPGALETIRIDLCGEQL